MKKLDFPKLVSSILICEAAGVIGSFFTVLAIPVWYKTLNKPAFSPPNWLFGPVWTVLYLLMGISLFLVWQKGIESKKSKAALAAFAIQLALNALWPIVFFGGHSPLGGLVVITLLLIFILITIARFLPISKTAATLLFPYLAWVSFAAVLNFYIVKLN